MQALVVAQICALAAWYHLSCVEPALWARRARPITFLILAVFTALAIGSFALLPILPGLAVWAVSVAWLALVAVPAFLLWLTPGRRSAEGDRARAGQLMALALDAAAVRDAGQWQEMMGALGRLRDPEAELFADAARK